MPKIRPPSNGTEQRQNGIKRQARRQALAALQVEKQFVQKVDRAAHGGDAKPAITPTSAARPIRLDSRARTRARRRRGISS